MASGGIAGADMGKPLIKTAIMLEISVATAFTQVAL